MIAAKIHTDRAREDLTKGPTKHKKRDTIRKKDIATGMEGGDNEQAEAFRASRAVAMMFGNSATNKNNVSFRKTNRNRSSVVAVVTKRVEMLHMNAISREFSPFMVRTCSQLPRYIIQLDKGPSVLCLISGPMTTPCLTEK